MIYTSFEFVFFCFYKKIQLKKVKMCISIIKCHA